MEKWKVKIEELSVGSLVRCRVSQYGAIYAVTKIIGPTLSVELSGARRGQFYPIDRIMPIKLTADLLIACGFTKDPDDETLFTYTAGFPKHDVKIIVHVFPSTSNKRYMPGQIKFLHQLQSLYLSLFNEVLHVDIAPNSEYI